MNAKQVLDKVMTILSLQKEEVLFTYAKLADGTILESPTFDVGEAVDVVTEDGKSPAPEGEHEVILKDSEGNDVRIKIMVDAEGKITERENVELPEDETEGEESEAVEMESIAGGDMGGDESEEAEDETAEPLTEDMGKVMQKLQYRIEELEKKMGMYVKEDLIDKADETPKQKMEPTAMAKVDGDEEEVDETEEELPKLDGAPIEEGAFKPNTNFGKKNATPQSTFLSKLYK
jgi:hypothetical protein